MSQNRMEQLIDELCEYIESCKPKGFSTTQVVVMKEAIYDIVDEMRLKIPEEIKRCAKVVSNKDQIIANAEERAERIIADAKRQAEMLVQESEIMRQAYLQANEMVARATTQANRMIQEANEEAEKVSVGALEYTNSLLAAVERSVAHTYEETKVRTEDMLRTLEENLRVIQDNRREINEDMVPQESVTATQEAPVAHQEEDDELYDLNGDDFFDNVE